MQRFTLSPAPEAANTFTVAGAQWLTKWGIVVNVNQVHCWWGSELLRAMVWEQLGWNLSSSLIYCHYDVANPLPEARACERGAVK